MPRNHQRRPSGLTGAEHLALLVAVALVGAAGVRALGGAMHGAIARDAAGDAAPASSGARPNDPGQRHRDAGRDHSDVRPGPAAQAGAAGIARAILTEIDPLVDLADEVRPVRTDKWSRPRFAFGDKSNPIQFSLELEGDAFDIAHLYRPRHVSDEAWIAREPEERVAFLERRLRRNEARGLREVKLWQDLRLRKDVYFPFEERLGVDLERWEVRTAGHVDTQDMLFAKASFLDEEVGQGGFHWHVSFERAAARDQDVLAYWEHADEYLRLYMMENDAGNIDATYVYPFDRSLVERVPKWLDENNLRARAKLHAVGLRGNLYGSPTRIGFEVRAANYDLGLAARVVESAVRFLEDPVRSRQGFSRGVSYAASDVRRVDRGLAGALPEVVERALGTRKQYERAPLRRWLEMPLERFEARPWLKHRTEEIRAARAEYLREITALAKAPGEFPMEQAGEVLHAWAKRLQLSEAY